MAITDEDRNHLFNTLRETLGAKDAARMMELLPPLGWSDVARQRDVDRRFDEIDRRFGELPQIFATKDDLRAQTNRYIGWMVVTNATLVAAVSLIVSLQ
jgi:hypothetical protein